jgi:hypothetical protein
MAGFFIISFSSRQDTEETEHEQAVIYTSSAKDIR